MLFSKQIEAIASNPLDIHLRVQLATNLEGIDPKRALEVWKATIRLVASRGRFFSALFLCRTHLTEGPEQLELLEELALRFGMRARNGEFTPPPAVKPFEVSIPEEHSEQIDAAVELATHIEGLGLAVDDVHPEVPVFRNLDTPGFVTLALALKKEVFPPKTTFIKQGNTDQSVYLLANGFADVTQTRPSGELVRLATVEAPAMIGEMSLLSALPRRSNLTAQSFCLTWRIDAQVFNKLNDTHPELFYQLLLLIKKRLLHNLVQTSPIFQSTEGSDSLLNAFEVRTIRPGEVVFEQNAPPPGLFVILHGEAEVFTHDASSDSRMRMAVLGEGDAFGEMSLLSKKPTAASVSMPNGGVLLHLSPEAYSEIRANTPEMEVELAELMFMRRGELQEIAYQRAPKKTKELEEVDDSWIFEQGN